MSVEYESINVDRAKQLEGLFPLEFSVIDGAIKGLDIKLNSDTHLRILIDSYSVKFCERVMAIEYLLQWSAEGNTPVSKCFSSKDECADFIREHNIENYSLIEQRYFHDMKGDKPLLAGNIDF